MIYTIYSDSFLVYDPRLPLYAVIDPILNLSVNEPGLLTFTVPDTNPSAGNITKLVSRIKVFRDSYQIFQGRAIKDERTLGNMHKYTVEGCIAFLIDSVREPYSFTGTPAQFFAFLLNGHNGSVAESQRLIAGSCTVTDENDITPYSELWDSTWNVMKSKLIDKYGGYLYVTFNRDSKPVLNWLAEPPDTATQKIEFGENLLSLAITKDADESYTACVPLGAKLKAIDPAYETEARLTIADVHDNDPRLIDSANAAIYGTIYAPVSLTTWDDVTLPTNLLHKAQAWLAAQGARLKETIQLTAVDLAALDTNVETFKFLDRVIVSCGDILPEAYFVLTKMTIPIQNPAATRITIGDSRASLVADNTGRINGAIDRIEGIESDYVTNSGAVEIVQQQITNNTSILQSAQQIIMSALEDYVATSDFEQFQSTVMTTLSVMAGTIEMNFYETNSEISDLNGDMNQQFEAIHGFIRMIASGIVIGESTSNIKLKLENDILYFFTGDEDSVSTENAIAYFSAGKLYVNTVQILTGMRIGPFAWMPESDNLNFKLTE